MCFFVSYIYICVFFSYYIYLLIYIYIIYLICNVHFNDSEDTQTFILLFQTAFFIPTDQVWSRHVPPCCHCKLRRSCWWFRNCWSSFYAKYQIICDKLFIYPNCCVGFLKHQLYVGSLQRITFLQLGKFTVGEGEGVGGWRHLLVGDPSVWMMFLFTLHPREKTYGDSTKEQFFKTWICARWYVCTLLCHGKLSFQLFFIQLVSHSLFKENGGRSFCVKGLCSWFCKNSLYHENQPKPPPMPPLPSGNKINKA